MCRAAQAIPHPFDSPMPSDPVGASMPGSSMFACSWSFPPTRLNSFHSHSRGKKPRHAIAAYVTPEACPFDRMNRSRSSHCGF